jgi:hypothetical protein
MRSLKILLICSSFALLSGGRVAAVSSIYTNKADFDVAIAGALGTYTETFSSLSPGSLASPQSFSNGIFSFSAVASSATTGLYVVDSAGDNWLAAAADASSLIFSFTSGNVTAVGGNLFLINSEFSPVSNNLILQLSDSTATNFTVSSAEDFFGFVSDVPVLSLSVTSQAADNFSTAANLTVANTVPEPSTFALLLAGFALLGFVMIRRKA